YPDPQTGQAMVHLELARLNIDFLAVLMDKTKGNLTEEEAKTLSPELIHALRLQFVDIQKEVAKAIEEGRIQQSPDQGGFGGPPPAATP
ncbi:MAG: DUF1844 domain-containing protein, partial [Phycisphaerales bacterium]|nr:DUF1844 domain-containing protein [Phycisphaerales bacterium]